MGKTPDQTWQDWGRYSSSSRPGRYYFFRDDPPVGWNPTPVKSSQQKLPISRASDLNSSLQLARRPRQFGTRGRHVMIKSNYYGVRFDPKQIIHSYEIQVTPEVKVKNLKIQILDTFRESRKDIFGRILPAFDGSHLLYTSEKLNLGTGGTFDFDFGVATGKKSKKFEMKFEYVTEHSLAALAEFLRAERIKDSPYPLFQALNTIFNHSPSSKYLRFGSSFFTGSNGSPIGNGVEVVKGFRTSIRPALDRLVLNINTASMAFVETGDLIKVSEKILGSRLDRRTSTAVSKLSSSLRHVQVEYLVKNRRSKFKIMKIVNKSADEHYFDVKDDEGNTKKTNVTKFFWNTYGINLRYPSYPLVEVKKGQMIPMELLAITVGNKFPKKLDGSQTANMISRATVAPKKRFEEIQEGSKDLFKDTDNMLGQYGLQIIQNFIEVDSRILDSPRVLYESNRHVNPELVSKGSWDLRGIRFLNAKRIDCWAFVYFGNGFNDRSMDSFIVAMQNSCNSLGMTFNRERYVYRSRGEDLIDIQDVIKKAKSDMRCKRDEKSIIVFIKPDNGKILYNHIKMAAEIHDDVLTSCVVQKNALKPTPPLCAGILSKINQKLGGINHMVPDLNIRNERNVPTIIFGADLCHNGIGRPSIAAITASFETNFVNYRYRQKVQRTVYRRAESNPNGPNPNISKEIGLKGTERIEGLEEMVVELFADYVVARNELPQQVLFYRDGISEGQFANAVETEVALIENAIDKAVSRFIDNPSSRGAYTGIRPKLSYITVQKRHNTRFYDHQSQPPPARGGRTEGPEKVQNCKPGTVVDQTITHPWMFDFFLLSHGALKGTSRPTHYSVLYDKNGFTADEIQEFTYKLCYIYSRATKAVSIPPPVYYSHHLAKRCSIYVDELLDEVRRSQPAAGSVSSGDSFEDALSDDQWDRLKYLYDQGIGSSLSNTMYYV